MKNAGHVFPIKGHESEEVKNAGHAFPIKGHERKEVSSEEGRMPFGAWPAPKDLTQILNS